MTLLEDDLRTALRAEAQALRVPERPELDRDLVEIGRRPGPRWLVGAACLALVVAGVLAVAQRRAGDPEPPPPVGSVVPDITVPAPTVTSVVPETTAPVAPVVPEPAGGSSSPLLGSWITTDILGRIATMIVDASNDDGVTMLGTDFAWVCSGASTMAGAGRLQTDAELVFQAPVLTCDDGSQPESLNAREAELQNLTLTRDPVTDILTDNLGRVWTREGADPSLDAPRSEAAETELLDGFLEARVAGDGAQRYLNVPDDNIPLLYSTTSGAPYERAEFERVTGIEWPDGFTAFKVRLSAGDTVVEQLFFTPAAGRLGLEYQPDSFGTDIAPTSEDGQPLAVPHDLFGGEVTVQVPYPWTFDGTLDGRLQLIPRDPGERPTTEGGERNHWDEIYLMADPAPVAKGCPTGLGAADAKALAESLRSDPALGATAPVAVRVGGVQALMMDVAIPAGTTICTPESYFKDLLGPVFDFGAPFSVSNLDGTIGGGVYTGRATGELMRLYLFDAPEGSSIRTLAIAIAAPAPRFGKVVETAAPVVESIEFHAP